MQFLENKNSPNGEFYGLSKSEILNVVPSTESIGCKFCGSTESIGCKFCGSTEVFLEKFSESFSVAEMADIDSSVRFSAEEFSFGISSISDFSMTSRTIFSEARYEKSLHENA